MQLALNQRLVKRYSLMGNVFFFGGLATAILVLVLSFTRPEDSLALTGIALGAFVIAQIGVSFVNRYGRHPRIDELISDSLKGLDGRFSLFHYLIGFEHVLIGPPGVFILSPRNESGVIRYEDGAWDQTLSKGSFFRRAGRRPIRSIDREAQRAVAAVERALRLTVGDIDTSITPVLVFYHPDAKVEVVDSPILAVHIKKLKGAIRKMPKDSTLPESAIDSLLEFSARYQK
ncbi:MAG TPA: hypothetical protein VJK02_24120 [Anaerolineales bacterium]|nr:hypothetical protein [Anaerolineales bacterium]